MNTDQIMSLARTLFKIGGTVLVTKGLADSGTIETIMGGLLALIGLVTSHIFHGSDPSTVKPPAP